MARKAIALVEERLEPEQVTIAGHRNGHALARACLDEVSDYHAALDWMVERVLADKEGLQAFLPAMVRDWCVTQISRANNQRNASIVRAVVPLDGSKMRQAVGDNFARMMDLRIAGGVRLGQATAADLYASATFHDTTARNAGRQARFHASVAEALVRKRKGEGARVGDYLTETKLRQLWDSSGDE